MRRLLIVSIVLLLTLAGSAEAKHKPNYKRLVHGELVGVITGPIDCLPTEPNCPAAPGYPISLSTGSVERHAICWTGHHWAVWQPQRHSWKHSQRPCKRLWAKGWALVRGGRVIGIHKQKTLVSDLPDPQASEARG